MNAQDPAAAFELGRGDDACLLVHGFTGTPWDVRPLGEALAARGYYVRAIRLPGHGTNPDAMVNVTARDWEQACEDALLSLGNFRQVFVAGLSMGGLLSLLLAAKHPERVHGLALIAPAVRFLGPTMTVLRATRGVPWLEVVHPWVHKTTTDIADERIRAQAPMAPRFPSAWLRELWTIQDHARETVPLIRCPTLVAVAKHDHVVDPKSGRALAKALVNAPQVRFVQLEEGNHIIPRDAGGARLALEVGELFDRLRGAPLRKAEP